MLAGALLDDSIHGGRACGLEEREWNDHWQGRPQRVWQRYEVGQVLDNVRLDLRIDSDVRGLLGHKGSMAVDFGNCLCGVLLGHGSGRAGHEGVRGLVAAPGDDGEALGIVGELLFGAIKEVAHGGFSKIETLSFDMGGELLDQIVKLLLLGRTVLGSG